MRWVMDPVRLEDTSPGPRTFSGCLSIPWKFKRSKPNVVSAAKQALASFNRTWDVAQLRSAITLYQQAVNDAPQSEAYLLGELGHCLHLYFDAQGNLDDLQRAIAADQSALQLVPDGHPDRALRLHNLSASLRNRFESLGTTEDLASAIEMQLHAVELTPIDHPDLPNRLDNLGYLQWLRFRRFGEIEDLESAISNLQCANELTADNHPNKASRLHNLALSLRTRFERLGDSADLERAVTMQRRAVELTPIDHPNLPNRLDNLGSLQQLRFGRFGEPEDLESAISNLQCANELTADNHPNKASTLHNFALSLRTRFERLDDPADLERAITSQCRVVELTPNDHPALPTRLNSLGFLQWQRFRRFDELEDIETAISNQERANALTPDDHPSKAIWLSNLASSLVFYFYRERTMNHFSEALSCYIAATSRPLDSPADRLKTAIDAVEFLNNTPEYSTTEMLLLAHSRVLNILSDVVWPGHSMERRLEESQKLGKLVSSAVCAAVRVNATDQALEWLETGRTLIWSQTLSLRSPLHDLEQAYPDLARALNDVHVRMQDMICLPSHSDDVLCNEQDDSMTGSGRSHADIQRGLAIAHGKLLSGIRKLQGFEDFMLPKKLHALLPASTRSGGPVVFINVDRVRCDALILLADGSMKVVALPDLSLQRATILRSQWLSYLELHNVRERGTLRDTPRADHHSEGSISARHILSLIWRWIVRPILEGLGIYGLKAPSGSLPHVTWCPTGPLTQLPLHAAGGYPLSGPRVYDFVVSSYTPSLSALTRSIDAVTDEPVTPSVLVVTQSDVSGYTPIPGTLVEGERVREVLAQSKYATSFFTGDKVSKAAVRTALNQHTWLHLACHGTQNAEDPLQSAFALHDGPLSLLDLMSTRADNAELAFLSACQTAVGDEKIPEESMHLAAGMLAVGYKGVIATMWSIGDKDAPVVVKAYYRRLLKLRASGTLGKGETGAAYALHEATRKLREKVGYEKFARWAPFVHFGI
ncbi:unnamed protein product [Peniophora sp. CBMAI 1063]|nr:unnamed protein product [Peniophora sp. CBMAI 1063]